jgi:anaerobic magnesium-protoporphyrin IX monomethyl ester cyclase
MRIVLWDTRQRGVTKDYAGGFGMGEYHGGGGVRGRIIRRMYRRDRRPVALNFAYLAAIFRRQGHAVEYCEDRLAAADVYVFNPALITLDLEREAMRQARALHPGASILVTGAVAHAMPLEFADLEVTVVRGEAEQLLVKLDEALSKGKGSVDIGSVADVDTLPMPDWEGLGARRFRVGYDFSKFPTAFIQASRGCSYKCNYCPYILIETRTRFRSPRLVAEEMERGMRRWGFRSFKFRDPLFGLHKRRVQELVEAIEGLSRRVQFSIETRIDLMGRELLSELRRVGLTSVTVGIETPDEATLARYRRRAIADDRQREFVATCRELGIRTAAGFMIGFPDDDEASIRGVLAYAKRLNPTVANFNIVTPYPGTQFYAEHLGSLSTANFADYSMYTPVMECRRLTRDQVLALHAKCFTSYFFRWRYLAANAHLWRPGLRWLGFGRATPAADYAAAGEAAVGDAEDIAERRCA